jgi:probable HAF family extracellular repeat protein
MATHPIPRTALNVTTRAMLTALLSLFSARMWADSAATVSQIDAPNATYTDALGINNRGDIVGSFADAHGLHGYILRRGTFTTLDFPAQGVAATVAKGINDRGQVVGFYVQSGSDIHGFVWDGTTFTQIDAPDADITYLHGINNRGQVVGHSRRDIFALARGFVWANGDFTFMDIPGVLIVGQRDQTMAINDGGQVVGSFQRSGVDHGFLFGGRDVTQIDVPSSIASRATGINNGGQIVGSFRDASQMERGFLRNKDGSITVIEAPRVASIAAVGINDRSEIVGLFTMPGGDFHGFLYAPSSATSSRR